MTEGQLDRKDLKIQALLEKISHLTTQYENNAADLRVDLTVYAQENERLSAEIELLRNELEELRTPSEVQEDAATTDDAD
jgi:regulator of replication initiation timing